MSTTNTLNADTAPQRRVSDATLELPALPRLPAPAMSGPPAVAAGPLRWTAAIAIVVTAAALGGAAAVAGRPLVHAIHRPASSAVTGSAVTSYDPSGGSGLAHRGALWTSQHYRTATFGGLKPGVGLLLDLGSARRLSAVSLRATPGAGLELRTGDTRRPSTVVARAARGGSVSLEGSGAGAHRYWLVFVTRLAPADGSWAVSLTTPRLAAG